MQTTIQEKEENKKQIISLVFLVLSIVIGFFFTMDQGYGYIEKKDTMEATKKEASEKKSELGKLQETAKDIENRPEIQNDIERYGGNFREDVILDSLFAPINGISIANITMSPGGKVPNGLSLATITLSLKTQDVNALNNYLDYLTNSTKNTKSYIVKSLTFPMDTTRNEAVSVSLSLGMYYFE